MKAVQETPLVFVMMLAVVHRASVVATRCAAVIRDVWVMYAKTQSQVRCIFVMNVLSRKIIRKYIVKHRPYTKTLAIANIAKVKQVLEK